jgi:hypothetical protein
LAREVVHVERRVLVQSRETHDEAEVVRELEPGRDVRVVVESRHDDLVAGTELPSHSARQREAERRHVGAERDGLVVTAEEARRGLVRLLDQRLRADAGSVGAADIGVGLPEVRRDGFDHRVRHLRAARSVEERRPAAKRREAGADSLDVVSDRAHAANATEAPSRCCAPSERVPTVRRMRMRPLSETECYARCYGSRDEQVRVVRLEPRRPRYALRPSGEDLRRYFEERLDDRIEPEAA